RSLDRRSHARSRGEVVSDSRAPTIYVEWTTTFRHDHGTGIPRVANAIVRQLGALAPAHGYDVVPVYLDGGALRPATLAADGGLGAPVEDRAAPPSRARRAMDGLARAMPAGAARNFVAAPSSQPGLARLLRGASERLRARPSALAVAAPGGVPIGTRDILLHADIHLGANYRALHAALHEQGTPVCAVVYDLIPVRHPAIWPVVRDDLARYIAETPGLTRPRGQSIEWFHLGHDMDASRDHGPIRDSMRALFATDTPVLLCVGWLDPRKNQPRLIEAVATLQARGVTARLVLIG